jgi:hypothetical protein
MKYEVRMIGHAGSMKGAGKLGLPRDHRRAGGGTVRFSLLISNQRKLRLSKQGRSLARRELMLCDGTESGMYVGLHIIAKLSSWDQNPQDAGRKSMLNGAHDWSAA